jgi:hypothetical protein
MDSLRLTRPGDPHPFTEEIRDAFLAQLAGDGLPDGPAAITSGRAWPMPVRHRGLFPRR